MHNVVGDCEGSLRGTLMNGPQLLPNQQLLQNGIVPDDAKDQHEECGGETIEPPRATPCFGNAT